MLSIFELEASEGAGSGDTGAAAGLTPEAADPGAPGEAADLSAVSAPAAVPVWDTPEFQDAVASQAAEIANARFAELQQMVQTGLADQPAGVQAGAPPFPDQYSENYAQEMAAYMAYRDDQLLSKIDQRISPVTDSLTATEQARVAAEGDQRVQDMIADDIARNGDLGETARALIRPIAEARYGEYAARYGEGRRAAEAAIQSAAATIRQMHTEAGTAAATAEVNRINGLAGIRDQIGTGAAGVSGIQEIELDPRKLVEKHSQRMHALNNGN